MQRLILSILFLSLAGALLYLYILPSYEEMKILSRQKTARESVLAELKELSGKRSELEEAYNSISEEDKKKLDELAPSTPRLADFLLKLDAIASRNGMIMPALNFSEQTSTQGTGGFVTLGLDVSVTGTYESLRSYLEDLEKYIRIVDVTDTGFASPAKAGDLLKVNIKGKSYLSPGISPVVTP